MYGQLLVLSRSIRPGRGGRGGEVMDGSYLIHKAVKPLDQLRQSGPFYRGQTVCSQDFGYYLMSKKAWKDVNCVRCLAMRGKR